MVVGLKSAETVPVQSGRWQGQLEHRPAVVEPRATQVYGDVVVELKSVGVTGVQSGCSGRRQKALWQLRLKTVNYLGKRTAFGAIDLEAEKDGLMGWQYP
jgi:hypothetical protein